MSVLFKVTKAKSPFRNGIFQVKEAASVVEIEQVVPEVEITEPVVEEPVEEVVEETIEEPAPVEEIVDPKLADCTEFSEKSVEYLGVNNITTVGELKDYLQNNNGDLTLLAKIGKKYAAVILEELAKWETNRQ